MIRFVCEFFRSQKPLLFGTITPIVGPVISCNPFFLAAKVMDIELFL